MLAVVLDRWRAFAAGRAGPGALIALGLCSTAIWWRGVPNGAGAPGFPAVALLLAGLQLGALAIAWRRSDRLTVGIVIGFALLFRVAAWSWAPELSSDLYRYVWDGRVQLAGHNPYLAAPDAPQRVPLRDEQIWPNINRPEAVTVYPPAAELAYLGLAAAGGDSVTGVKTAALGAELLALLLVVVAMARARVPLGRVTIYAWSPLVISEVCVSGHVDALVLPLLIGALLLLSVRRFGWGGALLGLATAVKLYPLVLLAAVPRGGRRLAVAAAAVVIAACYLPYVVEAGPRVLGFLPKYVRSGEDFNIAVRGFVEAGLVPFTTASRGIAIALCGCGFAAVAVWVMRKTDQDPFGSARTLAIAFVLLLPTAVHPWYAVWMVPLLAIRPPSSDSGDTGAVGLWLAIMLPLSYLKYGTTDDVMPRWVPWVEWLPALLLLGLIVGAHRLRQRSEGK